MCIVHMKGLSKRKKVKMIQKLVLRTYDAKFDFRRNNKGKKSFFFKKSTNPKSTNIDKIKNRLFLSTKENDPNVYYIIYFE